MPTYTFTYEDIKRVHDNPFGWFKDEDTMDFLSSELYERLACTKYVQMHGDILVKSETCGVTNHASPVFINLKGDYDYLTRWYHNPYRKANTRHGSYIMLYLTEEGYVWKLSKDFFTKILSVPDDITDLFDFG